MQVLLTYVVLPGDIVLHGYVMLHGDNDLHVYVVLPGVDLQGTWLSCATWC